MDTASYSIVLGTIEGETLNTSTIFLLDKVTGIVTTLSENNYNFTAAQGNYDNRFVLFFEEESILNISEDTYSILLVYPNPATSEITISNTNGEAISAITIFDTLGRVVQSIKTTGAIKTLDVSNFMSATYFIKIETLNGSVIKKFVKK